MSICSTVPLQSELVNFGGREGERKKGREREGGKEEGRERERERLQLFSFRYLSQELLQRLRSYSSCLVVRRVW